MFTFPLKPDFRELLPAISTMTYSVRPLFLYRLLPCLHYRSPPCQHNPPLLLHQPLLALATPRQASLLGFATETITIYTSQTIGGLVNATLGNAVELIVAIIALIKCELQVVQSSLIGSILSNLLLVCGCCFLAGE